MQDIETQINFSEEPKPIGFTYSGVKNEQGEPVYLNGTGSIPLDEPDSFEYRNALALTIPATFTERENLMKRTEKEYRRLEGIAIKKSGSPVNSWEDINIYFANDSHNQIYRVVRSHDPSIKERSDFNVEYAVDSKTGKKVFIVAFRKDYSSLEPEHHAATKLEQEAILRRMRASYFYYTPPLKNTVLSANPYLESE